MEKEIKLKCNRCLKEWNYHGEKKPNDKFPIYTSCPVCKNSVKIEVKNE